MINDPEPAAQPPRQRRWMPVVAVTALIVVVAGGARSVADATASGIGPVTVGEVRVQPAEGWQIEGTVTPTFAELHKGAVALDITVGPPVPGGPIVLATLYRERRLEPSFARFVSGAPDSTVTASGAPAVGLTYFAVTGDGVALDGRVIAVDTTRASVIFDARAPSGELPGAIEDVRAMVEGASV
jgi:hypothetical protein